MSMKYELQKAKIGVKSIDFDGKRKVFTIDVGTVPPKRVARVVKEIFDKRKGDK